MKRGSALNRAIDRFVGIPLLLGAGWLRKLRRKRGLPLPARERVQRVGVLTSTTIGDTLLASAAVQRVRAIWPRAELVFFAADSNRAAAEMLPCVDRVETIRLTRVWRSVRTMRRAKLDVMADFSAWQRVTAFLCVSSGAKFVAGFRRAGQHRHFAFDLTAEHRGDRHESENFAALANALEQAAGVPVGDAEIRLKDEVLATPLDAKWRDAVVFHCWATGANAHLREWPEERWVELAARLREKWPEMRLVLTAGAADMSRAEALAARLGAEVFASKSTGGGKLQEVVALLRDSQLIVSVNTGTMHLAAIVGARVIGLSGPTNDMHWGPRGARATGIQAAGSDCGYLDLGWEFAKGQATDCMERIKVSQVVRAADCVR